ncbi:hypothetical protein [Dactylosporangium sp. CA-233914]|uniref:hypothetical protein n=1 Tax=Dactylosporangium sp. CA-233914 TaxID=3239934 RepID=UPI003D909EF1
MTARKRAELDTVRVLLTQLGITPEELLSNPAPREMPTFADYIDRVAEAVTPGTRNAYCESRFAALRV